MKKAYKGFNTNSVTNHLKVLRILTKEEVLKISNTGKDNTGYICSGNRNSGNRNSGNSNSGNSNSGDWNSGDWNSGFFNTKENKCFIFDKISNFTTTQFHNSDYYNAISSVSLIITEWIYYTEDEKKNDKAKELIGCYLKKHDYKDACKAWWSKLTEKNKKIIQTIPNFDKEKFFEITGIVIEEE